MTQKSKSSLNYRAAGVDIERANALIETIKPSAKRTHRPEVLADIGGFGAMFAVPSGFKEPVLVSSTDGVGTKLKLALECKQHETIGIDLVAMCVNDVICHGAEPLFFLDYYSTSKLDNEIAQNVIEGIADGCEIAGCSLIGGETAEMPNLYQNNDYDLAGFSVGIVERQKIIDGSQVREGDTLIALAASGPHSNGYSLIRKILNDQKISLETKLAGCTLQEILLTPTRIYVNTIQTLLQQIDIHAIAHITGGGIVENLSRVLPENLTAHIDCHTWQWPQIFLWLQEQGAVSTHEMYRTFNLGVGMIICVPEKQTEVTLNIVNAQGDLAWQLGTVTAAKPNDERVILK